MGVEETSRSLEQALLRLDRPAVSGLVAPTMDWAPESRAEFADRVIAPALTRIGAGWDLGTVALSQVYMAGRILDQALTDAAVQSPAPLRPGIIAVGVLGDRHTLGKSLVRSVLRCAGHEVVDLGGGLSVEKLATGALDADARIVMASVLMLNRALEVRGIRTVLDAHGRPDLAVVVGGAPFVMDPGLGLRVGADRSGQSAADALRIASELLGHAA